jgi:hypothetical protein
MALASGSNGVGRSQQGGSRREPSRIRLYPLTSSLGPFPATFRREER